MKQGLIVIDMQNGVFSLHRPVYEKDALIENVSKAVRFARDHAIPIIFSMHENDTFLKPGTVGHQIINRYTIHDDDSIIRKTHPDIFINTHLDEMLRQQNITSLIITGVISNGCVRCACQSALQKQYNVTLVKDAHSTFYSNGNKVIERINREMQSAGVRIVSAEELR